MKKLILLSGIFCIAACGAVVPSELEQRMKAKQSAAKEYQQAVHDMLVFETTRGRLIFRLFPDAAPQTVKQVRAWTQAGVYDNTWFHRVVREPAPFVIQGGDIDTARVRPATVATELEAQALQFGFGATDPALPPEISQRKHTPGALALAVAQDGQRAGPQFVIALAKLPHLDGQEPVFGQLVGGWSVLQQIRLGDTIERAYMAPPEDLKGDWLHDIPPAE